MTRRAGRVWGMLLLFVVGLRSRLDRPCDDEVTVVRSVGSMDDNAISGQVVDAAIKVHSALGPGLLESAYRACLAHELRLRGLSVEVEVPVPIEYEGLPIDVGYRTDLVVQGRILVETKAIAKFLPIHEAQVLSCLKLSRRRVGLLINFHVVHLRHGIRRLVNGY